MILVDGCAVGGLGRVVGAGRAVVAGAASEPGRSETVAGSAGGAGHPARVGHRHRLRGPAAPAGIRIRDDVLAAPAGLAGNRGRRPAPRGTTGRAQRGRADRLVPGVCGCLPHSRQKEAPRQGRALLDRSKTGSKYHLICDGGGIPLAVTLTSGNRHDITQLLPLVEAIPPVRGRRGRPRHKPEVLVAERGYDHDTYRHLLRQLGIRPLISRRGTRDTNQPVRWVVEQTLALLALSDYRPALPNRALRKDRRQERDYLARQYQWVVLSSQGAQRRGDFGQPGTYVGGRHSALARAVGVAGLGPCHRVAEVVLHPRQGGVPQPMSTDLLGGHPRHVLPEPGATGGHTGDASTPLRYGSAAPDHHRTPARPAGRRVRAGAASTSVRPAATAPCRSSLAAAPDTDPDPDQSPSA
ncbi:Transposase DDE domain-containing protein [Actinopolyspora lacussalsi subsp. righensis]|uniref:Transposase DDE domain-containing protein n=1 Tax=Actinopolyspora righensis TaxID=995060 RepID=A0A1I6XG68_9ACTN|nr:Transposase DDE domain-containing protein [Actinopolyspora righensis]